MGRWSKGIGKTWCWTPGHGRQAGFRVLDVTGGPACGAGCESRRVAVRQRTKAQRILLGLGAAGAFCAGGKSSVVDCTGRFAAPLKITGEQRRFCQDATGRLSALLMLLRLPICATRGAAIILSRNAQRFGGTKRSASFCRTRTANEMAHTTKPPEGTDELLSYHRRAVYGENIRWMVSP